MWLHLPLVLLGAFALLPPSAAEVERGYGMLRYSAQAETLCPDPVGAGAQWIYGVSVVTYQCVSYGGGSYSVYCSPPDGLGQVPITPSTENCLGSISSTKTVGASQSVGYCEAAPVGAAAPYKVVQKNQCLEDASTLTIPSTNYIKVSIYQDGNDENKMKTCDAAALVMYAYYVTDKCVYWTGPSNNAPQFRTYSYNGGGAASVKICNDAACSDCPSTVQLSTATSGCQANGFEAEYFSIDTSLFCAPDPTATLKSYVVVEGFGSGGVGSAAGKAGAIAGSAVVLLLVFGTSIGFCVYAKRKGSPRPLEGLEMGETTHAVGGGFLGFCLPITVCCVFGMKSSRARMRFGFLVGAGAVFIAGGTGCMVSAARLNSGADVGTWSVGVILLAVGIMILTGVTQYKARLDATVVGGARDAGLASPASPAKI